MSTTCIVPDTELFLRLPTDDPKGPLHPLRVVEADEDKAQVAALVPIEGVVSGENVTVYFQWNGEFVKQPARVLETELDDLFVAELELLGEPVSAERRQTFRVSCAGCEITATLGEEGFCKVVDVSATGFGLYATQALRIGDIRDVALHYGGESHRGQVAVQSIRRLASNLVRYGLRAIDGAGDQGLVRSLPKVNAAVQRERLRRLS